VIIVVAVEPPLMIFLLCTVYAFSGPAYWLWRRRGQPIRMDEDEESDEP
jgi:hypothetical protein